MSHVAMGEQLENEVEGSEETQLVAIDGSSELDRMLHFLGERYSILQDDLGAGSFGRVVLARKNETEELVAIKMMTFEEWSDGSVPPHVVREVSVLKSFGHPNIVKLHEAHIDSGHYYLVFEHMDGDLDTMLRRMRRSGRLMPMDMVSLYARQLFEGVHQCHSRLLLHRDLKPANLLISGETLKICDFGLARIFSPMPCPYTSNVVSLWYRAPELLLGSRLYDRAVDIWAAGCCMAQMVLGRALFPGDSEIGTIFKIFEVCGTATEELWPGVSQLVHWKPWFPSWPPSGLSHIADARPDASESCLALLRSLLRLCPGERPSARQAKSHEFFGGLSAYAAAGA